MKAGDLALWRAWYDLEPRGDERADYLTAYLARLQITDDYSFDDVLEDVQDKWEPLTPARAKRKKAKRVKRFKAKQRANIEIAKAHGKVSEHRQVGNRGNA